MDGEALGYVCMCSDCGWLSQAYITEEEAEEEQADQPCPDCGSPGTYISEFE